MKRKNPCWGCESSLGGCGRHAQCERYLAFFNKGRELSAKRELANEISGYTMREIDKARVRGCQDTFRKYRNTGRW